MEEQDSQNKSGSLSSDLSSTSNIFKTFQELYAEQVKGTDESCDGLKLKVKVLENWVEDLTDQNIMLIKTVGELEGEALKNISLLEENLSQGPRTSPQESTSSGLSSREVLSSKGMSQIETLSRELEEVKKQLFDKEKVVCKYQTRLQELRSTVEDELCSSHKVYVNQYSMTESTGCDANVDRSKQSLPTTLHKELETTQRQLCHMEKEVSQLKKKLKEADSSIKRLRSDLVISEKNAKEMRSALTAEVAEKHDQILALRREVAALEDQLRQADMQTHFKDDIIKELRKEVKVARSKETLVEVLGIKERSLSHLEHLTEQLEQKDHTIACLKSKLQQFKENTPDMLYRVKQQVDWFSENVSQQCAKDNIPEEFKKCITTMLEELRESIECCNFGPTNTSESCKDSIQFLSALLDSLEQSQKGLCQSWASIWGTTHQINKIEMTQPVEQWKKCLCKQQSLHLKIQQLVESIIQTMSSSSNQGGCLMDEIDSLYYILCEFKDQLSVQPNEKTISNWLKKLWFLISQSLSKIEEISQIAATVINDESTTLSNLQINVTSLESLECELTELQVIEQKAYERLKNLKMKCDSLLVTVLHHNEMWNQQRALSDDMKKEILSLNERFKQKIVKKNPHHGRKSPSPIEKHSLQAISLVSQISTEIRSSISDIETRENQVSHLEVDLSSVRVVLESAQEEIENISKNCKVSDMADKVMCLLDKLNKEVTNALKKAENLIDVYKISKQDYTGSSKRINSIQKEFNNLEEELQRYHNYICKNYNEPTKTPTCDKRVCPIQAELENYKKKNEAEKDAVLALKDCNLEEHYKELQRALVEKDKAAKQVKDNIMELKSNLKDREKLIATQDKTIQLLQSSLKLCQKEAEDLRGTVGSLELKQTEIEKDCKKQTQLFQNKIFELQNVLKQSEDCTKKHQKSEAAFQIVIANLKEKLSIDQKKVCDLFKENNHLKEQLTNLLNSKAELVTINKREMAHNQESQNIIAELRKQVKCWSVKAAETEERLKGIHEKQRDYSRHEENYKEEFLAKEAKYKDDLCMKQAEINRLSNSIKLMKGKLKDISTELESEKVKYYESEQKLQAVCTAYDELKFIAKEKDSKAEKLNCALTQLSNKFVSRRLDNDECLRHFQEECAKFEALYNTTSCKLHSKEREVERLKAELDHLTGPPLQEREEESCPFLLERVQQLSKDLQLACSRQNSYEKLVKEMTEKCSKKDEDLSYLRMQLKQVTLQRDTVMSDLEGAQEEISSLKTENSNLQQAIKKLGLSKSQIADQMKSVQRMLCDSQTSSTPQKLQPNIELQREISSALSSQLRSIKQKLHTTRHDYKLLQTAYEELNRKYSLLQKSERDPTQSWDPKPNYCTPCMSKPSKSFGHLRYTEDVNNDGLPSKYSIHSKSWHKLGVCNDFEETERKWKQKLQEIMRGDEFDTSDE